MTARNDRDALEGWRSIPGLVHGLIAGASENDLDRRRDEASMSLRELVHHIAEANAVAASALNAYVAAQVEPLADGLQRTVQLRDEPEGPLRSVTVAEVLLQELDHAREHAAEAP